LGGIAQAEKHLSGGFPIVQMNSFPAGFLRQAPLWKMFGGFD